MTQMMLSSCVFMYKRDGTAEEWQDVEDASYCTCFSADADEAVQMKALEVIMDRVYDKVITDASIKKICEELSYLSENNFEQQSNMPTEGTAFPEMGPAIGEDDALTEDSFDFQDWDDGMEP